MTVFVSDAVGDERLPFRRSPSAARSAGERRSWAALSRLYRASLAACGRAVRRVERPEIYQAGIARTLLGVAAGDWHLAVTPIADLRPFHGLPNVLVCDWPYPELSGSDFGLSPFLDQLATLRKADAVLCPTAFTAETLRRAGLKRVVTLPPLVPIRPPDAPSPPPSAPTMTLADLQASRPGPGTTLADRLAALRTRGRTIILATLGADEPAAEAVIRGVAGAIARSPGLSLILEAGAAWPDGAAWPGEAARRGPAGLPGLGQAAREIVLVGNAAEESWAETVRHVDFVLCGSPAAGLSPRLVEAMAAGVPVVASLGAGPGSYLTPEAAVPIAAPAGPVPPEAEPMARHMRLTGRPPAAEAIREAVLAAVNLPPEGRRRMAEAARDILARDFSRAAFEAGLARLGAWLR